ncbi:FAD-dependent oxidoreductase [Nonomuraea typhae]|uniref:FAD-dependent oxidoreductase n=1 Tax=Nonomuraea typhae TaxID=2603600 RepID=UPI0012FB372C|nr:NAD(P)/FAD-dependent oxidoreductase [Nonomuraea typhae]
MMDCGVVGMDPAGLVLAILLARSGWNVTVVDRVPDPRPAGISPFLSPQSLELLDDLGLFDEVAEAGRPVREVVEHFPDGRSHVVDYGRHTAGRFGYTLSVPLPTLTGILRNALAGRVSVSSGVPVELDAAEGVVTLDSGETVGCRFLVGCDGKFSKFRRMSGIEVEVVAFDRPLMMTHVPAIPGWPDRITVHHTDRGPVTAIPLAESRMIVQWIADREDEREFRSQVASAMPEVSLTEGDRVMAVRHHVVRPKSWSRGRAGLLGDAAHGVHSFGGQGLSLGVQDAMVLAYALVRTRRPFAYYEQLRRPFVERFQDRQMASLTYAGISDAMLHGQPEAWACYQRL